MLSILIGIVLIALSTYAFWYLPFPSVGRVAVAGELFRWVPVWWDY